MFHSLSSLHTSASFLHNKISLKRLKNLGHQLSQSWETQELLSSIYSALCEKNLMHIYLGIHLKL